MSTRIPTRSISSRSRGGRIGSAGVAGLSALVVLAGCSIEERPDADRTFPDRTTASAGQAAPQVEYLTTPEMASLGFPFSEAVRVGGMLFLSGQVGNLPGEASVVPGGIEAESRQVMENIKAVVERYGSSMDRIVKCTVMIDEMSEWGSFNTVYATYFPGAKPARSAFGADGLALGAAVEVECWATVGDNG